MGSRACFSFLGACYDGCGDPEGYLWGGYNTKSASEPVYKINPRINMPGTFNDLVVAEDMVKAKGIALAGQVYPMGHLHVKPAHILHGVFKIPSEDIALGGTVEGRKSC